MNKPVWAVTHAFERCGLPCAGQIAQMLDKKPVQYLYGLPNSSGAIALRDGSTSTRYHGTVTAKLPVWDWEKYPHAYLVDWPAEWSLMVMSTPLTFDGEGYTSGSAAYMKYDLSADGRRWICTRDSTTSGAAYSNCIWSAQDLLAADGTVHLAGSAPIPVTGVVAYRCTATAWNLPKWIEDYAYVTFHDPNLGDSFLLATDTVEIQKSSNLTYGVWHDTYAVNGVRSVLGGGVWREPTAFDRYYIDGESPYIDHSTDARWANVDLYCEDDYGAQYVICSGSPAIPVYERSE